MLRVRMRYWTRLAVLGALLVGPAWLVRAQPPAETCARCHAQQYEGWARSAHARASAAFQAIAASPAALGTWGSDGCRRCHAPLGGSGAVAGISCEGCHLLDRVDGVGNGAFHVATDGVLRSTRGSSSPHPTAASPLFSDSLFCAACHEQYHPTSGVVLQGTYTEWLNSDASREGKTCQTCHMAKGVPSHAFGVGGADAAAKGRALAQAIALDVKWPESARAGAPFIVDVRLENVAAGHALPTGKVEASEMWLEMAATVAGRTVFTETLPYGVMYADSEGLHEPPVPSVDAASVFRDHRLFPYRAITERFVFVVPSDARGTVDVEVRLMYRPTPAWLSERLALPISSAVAVHRASVSLAVLGPAAAPTYVSPTPTPRSTATPVPTGGPKDGTVRAEERGWLGPFFLLAALVLMAVTVWALRKRAV